MDQSMRPLGCEFTGQVKAFFCQKTCIHLITNN